MDAIKKIATISLALLLGFMGILVAITVFVEQRKRENCERLNQAEATAFSRIRVDWDDPAGLRGRITNQSAEWVSGFSVELTTKDCVGGNCVVVGEDRKFLEVAVPPGQARDFVYQGEKYGYLMRSYGNTDTRIVFRGKPITELTIARIHLNQDTSQCEKYRR
ncbi:MAG: hypothetical protein KIT07_09040 [Anaerolineales bacterium]|nr:hypothetical protein [Rhodocyclaceae bacterium]MCW5888254.1 hypothetical protein [Anaerolineales bacterium]